MVYTGFCRWFSEEKGYGFLMADDDFKLGHDVFVHAKSLRATKVTGMEKGKRVSFEIGENAGKKIAINVQII